MRVALWVCALMATSTAQAQGVPQGKNQRMLCGCASSRFLDRGPLILDASRSASAWLHGESHVDAFTKNAEGKLVTTTLPLRVQEFAVDNAAPGAARLVMVTSLATVPTPGFLGMVRPGDLSPRDVVTVNLTSPWIATEVGAAPRLTALWLAPLQSRERKDCGPWNTARIAFELEQGSPAVQGFLIRDGRTGRQSLVDARHAGAFGLGRVEVCDHGFAFDDTELVEIVPMSSSWGQGDKWVFVLDRDGQRDPRRLLVPASADEDLIDTAFPVPGTPGRAYSLVSVGGMWMMSAALGLLCGCVGFLFWRFKRRRMETVVCLSCHALIPVDVLDEKTDGFFCPSCGTAGLWKAKGGSAVAVTRL